ncbi:MAG TPA: hypothetical protein VLJ39_01350 [Tepidisphaeraceae bacterium]|nr:hypothetical protein [Tepidisphaeraceae bacterium]
MTKRSLFGRLVAGAFLSAAVVLWAFPAAGQTTRPAEGLGGPHSVETLLLEWNDPQRNRQVPVKIYYPADGGGKSPVIIFSHGLGGSREGYAYLGREWASHGYVSVHVQHVGSDDQVWRDVPAAERMAAMRKAAVNLSNILNRPRDISFVIDQLQKLNEEAGPLKGRLDLDRIGAAGHSFGAYTTQAVIGERFFPGGREASMGDPRIKAAVIMSPNAPKDKTQDDAAFAKIIVPCLHMTGTLDDSPIGDTKAADRRVAFDHTPATSDQFLIIFTGGDHMIFSGRPRRLALPGAAESPDKDARFQEKIRKETTTFWDAYLRGDESARKWMTDGDAKQFLGDLGTFEIKLKGQSK